MIDLHRKKIIFHNFKFPTKQLKKDELIKKKYDEEKTFLNKLVNDNCGDELILLVKINKKKIEKIYFSAQNSCLLTISSSNILCSYLEKKSINSCLKILKNFQYMLEGKKYNLSNFSNLEVFNNIINIPHRSGCVNLINKSISEILRDISRS